MDNTGKCCCPDRLGANTEDHGELVDDHSRAPKVVDAIEHIGTLELAVVDLMEIQTPDDSHDVAQV